MASIHLNERQYNDYVVNARIDRSEGPSGTIVINFFLGGVPRSPCDWERAEKLGVITFMGAHGYPSEARVVRYETGQISITNALMDLVEYKTPINGDVLMTLDRGEVARFLKKHLHWRVQSGYSEVSLTDLPSLRVSVAACIATIPERDDEFISYGKYEVVGMATKGRQCGFDPDLDTI